MSAGITIRFPLAGEWVALPTPGHHRFAFDFAVMAGWRLNAGGWLRYLFSWVPAADFHAWNRPILAPFAGAVVQAHDGESDHDPINMLRGLKRVSRPTAGNFVTLESQGVYALLVHFQRGSIRVQEGDKVAEGQTLGRVGNSGRSLFPHLHLQFMDDKDFTRAQILPFKVEEFERWEGKTWKTVRGKTLSKARRYRFGG